MKTNMTGFRCFFPKSLRSCALGESCLSMERDISVDATFFDPGT